MSVYCLWFIIEGVGSSLTTLLVVSDVCPGVCIADLVSLLFSPLSVSHFHHLPAQEAY